MAGSALRKGLITMLSYEVHDAARWQAFCHDARRVGKRVAYVRRGRLRITDVRG